jgi:hypothetical protein
MAYSLGNRTLGLALAASAGLWAAAASAAVVARGPYLQQGTPTSIIVRWRTDVATDSRVRYGNAPGSLNSHRDVLASTTEHQVTVTGLTPNTKYYYSVGTIATPLAGDATHFFYSAPAVGPPRPLRIWATGDFGTGNARAMAVRDAYESFTGNAYTNLWLMLGDNAYEDGTDSEYQTNVFDVYPTRLRQTVAWPTLGNHDAHILPPSYYQIFSLPASGEVGGLASGTEHYYSFDYANIHFVCLNSMTEDRSPSGAMLTWLDADLAATSQDWIIAFWHHPPYSRGTHTSDSEGALVEMRENALPILESRGVDLVLSGHSHDYERSYLLNGHYGSSATFDKATMALDPGSGRSDDTGAYRKPTLGPAANEGAVYVVNGNAGKTCTGAGCGSLDHPAMYVSFGQEEGSVAVDVDGKRLDFKYLRSDGAIRDYFTIFKGAASPSVSISDVSISEGDTSTRNATFAVALSSPGDTTATIDYATSDGTAATPGDYTAVSGKLTYPAGTTLRTLNVPIKGDMLAEGDEVFYLDLSHPTNAVIDDGQGQATILDDDAVGELTFSAGAYTVGEAAASAIVTVRRTGKAAGGAIDYATSDGTAIAGSDYTPGSGTLTFAQGVSSRTFSVAILHDTIHEPGETLLLKLGNPVGPGASLGPADTSVLTIADNDVVPLLRFSAPKYTASEAGGSATITVRRVGVLANQATVDFATSNGSATAGQDYTQTSGTLTFPPGVASQTFTVPITDDAIAEANETVSLALSNPQPPSGVALGSLKTATITITDNDQALRFSAATYTVNEATPKASITVKRIGGTTGSVNVDYAATGGTATAATDYTLASATLTLNQGQATKTFLVNIQNDTAVEGSETVELSLANATGATIVGPNPAVLTITDNEPVLQFVAPKYVVAETAPEARITVRRTGALTSPATVDYQITGGTATDGSDYTVSTGTLSFAPGKPTQTLSVGIVNDSVDEPNETVNLGLVNPSSGYGIGTPGQAVLTINDNDTAGEVQFSVVAYSVGEGGGLATIAVTRTGTSELATVDYATSDETATTAGSDYTGTAGTLSFGLGETTATIQVPINDDTLSEGNEYLTLTLGNPGGGLVLGSRSAATLWIVDDD